MQSPVGGAILIHGLQEGDIDPLTQFTDIKPHLLSITPNILPFEWGKDKDFGFPNIYKHLRKGDFGETLAESFSNWLSDKARAFGPNDRLVVVTYSIGGLIFYRWVTYSTVKDANIARICLAVTIASPYQCLTGTVGLEAPGGTRKTLKGINEPQVNPADILKNLPDNTLKVVLAENDITILREDSEFVGYKEQHIIKGATHRTIYAHDQTLKYIRTYCQNLIDP